MLSIDVHLRYFQRITRGALCRTMLVSLLLALAATATGCGDDASSSNQPDASERDGAPGPADAMRPGDASEVPDADPNAPDSGSQVCGGLANIMCPDTHYCDYPDNDCGAADATGTCLRRPDACLPVITPVCGCDQREHQNECEAYRAGTDISSAGGC
jgi:hypothetical protein